MPLNDFRKEIESICKIIEWKPTEPTDKQLESIRNDFDKLLEKKEKLTIGVCQGVITRHCPKTIYLLREGVDNSDLNALLSSAVKQK